MSADRVNVPLLRKAVEWAEAEAAKPRELSEWEQGFYVIPASPSDPLIQGTGGTWSVHARSTKAPECGTCYCVAGYVASISGRPWNYHTAATVAKQELGISEAGSHALFSGDNSIEDVRRIAEKLAGESL